MKEKVVKIILGAALAGLIIAPFPYSVYSARNNDYGTQDNRSDYDRSVDEIVTKDPGHYSWERSTAGQVANSTTSMSVTIGANSYSGGASVSGVSSMINNQGYAGKIAAVGANVDNGETAYSKVSTEVGPAAKAALSSVATSRGYVAGGTFNIQNGIYRAGQVTIPETLKGTINYDLYVTKPAPGYKNSLLVLLPDGSVSLLNSAFYYTQSVDDWTKDMLVLHTPYPNATYMFVQIPANS